jgi:hypothetical protein
MAQYSFRFSRYRRSNFWSCFGVPLVANGESYRSRWEALTVVWSKLANLSELTVREAACGIEARDVMLPLP